MQASASKIARTAAPASRRTQAAEVTPSNWAGPSNIVTFLRCLRLLDLDLRDDWPLIHEQLFSAKISQQNLQQRVKCVEWSLYRLFETWDPAYTKDVRRELHRFQFNCL